LACDFSQQRLNMKMSSAASGRPGKQGLKNPTARFVARLCLACVFGLPPLAIPAAVTNIVWYRLGETDPGAAPGMVVTNTHDLIRNGILRTIGAPLYTNDVSPSAGTHVGSTLAVQFTGGGQYFTNSLVTVASSNFCIEAWVKPNTTISTHVIAYNGDPTTNGWGIYQNGTNYLAFFGSLGSFGGGQVTPGTWTHVALACAGGPGGGANLFINGVASAHPTNIFSKPFTKPGPFSIGAFAGPPASSPFNGEIDEVRVFTFGAGQFNTGELLVKLQRVTTQPASEPGPFNVTLNGSANAANLVSIGWFEWGPTTNFGNTTPAQPLGNDSTVTNFSETLTGLLRGATYQFRAVVSNSLGIAVGDTLSAATIPVPSVTSTNDDGPGSLRQALSDALPGDTILFAPGVTGTIVLSNSELVVDKPLSIIGPGVGLLTIQAAGYTNNVFEFDAGPSTLSGVMIYGGWCGVSNNADLSLTGCSVLLSSSAGLWHNQGTMRLLGCTIADNLPGWVIGPGAVAFATNCSFNYNDNVSGSGSGGAISNSGTLMVRSCTIVDNFCIGIGGGVYNTGSADFGNTIVALNSANATTNSDQDLSGSFVSSGFNLIGQGDGSSGFVNGVSADQVGSDASPLDPAGYLVQLVPGTIVFMLDQGSPAIDQGNSFGTSTDQIGRRRPFDLTSVPNAAGGDGSDIGAVEFSAPVVCSPCSTQIVVDSSRALRTVDARWMGMNGAIWDSYFDTPADLSLLKAMGCRALRYPGGSASDLFHWATDISEGNSFHWVTAPGNFEHIATNLGAQVFITVNYGTGTTNEAADWVRSANITDHAGFQYWEIGNEIYGPWEADSNTVPPFVAHDGWTYAMRFRDFYNAMKAVDPTIKVGAVAINGEDSYVYTVTHSAYNPRTGQYHYGWTPVMLSTMRTNGVIPDFLVYHYYPEYQVDDDTLLLQAAANWSTDAEGLRQQLIDYLGDGNTNVELVCTENNSEAGAPGTQSTSLVNGLYLADSMSQMMKTEFNALMWFDLRNQVDPPSVGGDFDPALYGWRGYGDHGVMSGTSTIYPTYYAMKLMQYFAQPGDTVLECANANPFLSTYAARQASGSLTLLAINKDRYNTISNQVNLVGLAPNATATVTTYGIPQDEATRTNGPAAMQDISITNQAVSSSFSYAFPPYSLTLFTFPPAPPSITILPSVPGNSFSLQVQGQPGVRYIVQSSSNLVQWVPVQTNTFATGLIVLTNTVSPGVPAQFWRAVWQP
jgi:hypothetical protein